MTDEVFGVQTIVNPEDVPRMAAINALRDALVKLVSMFPDLDTHARLDAGCRMEEMQEQIYRLGGGK